MNATPSVALRLSHAALWLALALAAPASAPAQQILQTGHGLDNSLQLGSGGYNGSAPVGGRIAQPMYRGFGGGVSFYSIFQQEKMYNPAFNQAAAMPPRPDSGSRPAAESVGRFAAAYSATYQPEPADAPALTPRAMQQMEQMSYGLGYLLGEQLRGSLKRDDVGADIDQAVEGFRDGIFESPPRIPAAQLDKVLSNAEREVKDRIVRGLLESDAEFRRVHDENLSRGRAFQEEYGKRPGVVSLPNGIQYKVLRAGTGPSPGPDDVVVVTYKALLLDGTVAGEGESREVRVGSAIPGAAAAIQMMNAGAKWQVALPPELAYGSAGKYPEVGPNETLFGEIELLEIKPRL